MNYEKLLKRCGFVLVFLLLITTFLYYHISFSTDYFTLNELIENQDKYPNYNRNFMGPYGGSFDGGFFIIINQEKIKVFTSEKHFPPKYGEVLVYGHLNREGHIIALEIHNYNYAYFSVYVSSFIAIIFILFLFFKEWKITFRGIKDA